MGAAGDGGAVRRGGPLWHLSGGGGEESGGAAWGFGGVLPSPLVRDPAAVLAFVQRDWASASRSKARYWRDWKRRHGPAAGVRVAEELRLQVLRVRPDWPSRRERLADLAMHLRIIDALRRVPPRPR
jgi:hypothetical protein